MRESEPEPIFNFYLKLDLVGLKKSNELSKDNFLRLHEVEIENADANVDDMYQRLFNLGFNTALEIDQV